MVEQTAAGFILAWLDGEPGYLMLRNAEHGSWGFPKGHLEPGESPLEGARRELQEETGITEIELVPGFEEHQSYDVNTARRGRYRKHVVYFLATVPGSDLTPSPEHDAHGWYPYAQARALLKHPALRDALERAHERLTGGKH